MKNNRIIKTLCFCLGISISFTMHCAQQSEDWRFDGIQQALDSNNAQQLDQAMRFTIDTFGEEVIFDLTYWLQTYKQTHRPSEIIRRLETRLQEQVESFLHKQEIIRHEIPAVPDIPIKGNPLNSLLTGQIGIRQYIQQTGEDMTGGYLEILKQHFYQAQEDKPIREQIYTIAGNLANPQDSLSLIPAASYSEEQDTITLLPSLQQDLKSGDVGNYCGYYALFNADCFAKQRTDLRLSREAFIVFLNNSINMLRLTGQKERQSEIRSQKFGELDIQEIIGLLDTMHIPQTIVIGSPNLFIAEITGMPLEAVLGEDRGQTALPIEQFQRGILNKLIIILGTGAHYFTVLAERNPYSKAISLRAAESLPGSSYDVHVFESKILPLYYVLKGIPNKLTAATAEKFHIPIGGLAKNWAEFEKQVKMSK